MPQFEFIKKNTTYKYNGGDSYVAFNTFGLDEIPKSTIDLLKSRRSAYPALANTRVIFNQSRPDAQFDNMKYMERLRYRDSLDLINQSDKITYLENRVKALAIFEEKTIPFNQVAKEVQINYEALESFSYASEISSNFKKVDTVSVISVKWDKSKIKKRDIAKEEDKLGRWLKTKLDLDTLVVRRTN